MPKRKTEEKIKHYQRKLRKLEDEGRRKYNRIIYSSDESENSDNDYVEQPDLQTSEVDKIDTPDDEEPTLDPEILSALGETTTETPKFGLNIHDKLSKMWMPILKKGLDKDTKEKLVKEYIVPENCQFLQAPRLNPEISAALAESSRARDKKIETVQQQLGHGITALNRGLGLLLEDGNDKLQAIKFLSDSCRLLCDLHYSETEARKKCVTPNLDKTFLNIAQEAERDDLLYGCKLSEKIKATKTIEKQGLQIKKPPPAPRTSAVSYPPPINRPRQQGNWTGPPPPRFSSNRGGRGGQRSRGSSAGRRIQPAAPAPQKPSTQMKQPRATGQQ